MEAEEIKKWKAGVKSLSLNIDPCVISKKVGPFQLRIGDCGIRNKDLIKTE